MPQAPFDKSGNKGLRHFANAARFSAKGLKAAFQHEAAFRQEIGLLILSLYPAYLLASSVIEFVALIASILFVIVVELLNSAVEAAIDRIGSEHHELSGRAKDLGSAAVMISLIITGMIWLAIGYPEA